MDVRRDSANLQNDSTNGALPELSLGPSEQRVRYRLARSRGDFEGAFRILQRRYAESGLTRNLGAVLRIMPYHLWEATQVIVAEYQERIVGSITLVRDSRAHGLPMESTYPESIDELRSRGLRLGEVCGLCVGSDKTHSSGELFAGLTRMMMFHARFCGLDAITAVVHPRHGKFYRMAMGFQEIGGLSAYRQVGGQPGVPILGQVNDRSSFRTRWQKNYFDGDYSVDDLRPHAMSQIDRAYFSRYLVESGGEVRRAA